MGFLKISPKTRHFKISTAIAVLIFGSLLVNQIYGLAFSEGPDLTTPKKTGSFNPPPEGLRMPEQQEEKQPESYNQPETPEEAVPPQAYDTTEQEISNPVLPSTMPEALEETPAKDAAPKQPAVRQPAQSGQADYSLPANLWQPQYIDVYNYPKLDPLFTRALLLFSALLFILGIYLTLTKEAIVESAVNAKAVSFGSGARYI